MDNKMTAEQALERLEDAATSIICTSHNEEVEEWCGVIRQALSAPRVPEPRKANHADYGYRTGHEKPWFFYDPEGDGMVFTATEAEARAGAEEAIANSLDEFWSECVDQICYGRVIQSATQVDREDRPEILDEEGYTEDGEWWPEDCEFKCNYKLLPLAASPEPVAQRPIVWQYNEYGEQVYTTIKAKAPESDQHPMPVHAEPVAQDQHPDDIAVDRFAEAMKAKLAEARAKGRSGWDDPEQCSVEYLAELLASHTAKANAGNFVDVANFAMMLHMREADPEVMPWAFAFLNTEQHAKQVIADLRAEVEALRKDAERYRWLRDMVENQDLVIAKVGSWSLESWSGDDADAAIDAARLREGGE